jgi:hypothetical protein
MAHVADHLSVGATCAFSLVIAGQVLTFRTRAGLSFAPPTCQIAAWAVSGIPQTYPGRRANPRF